MNESRQVPLSSSLANVLRTLGGLRIPRLAFIGLFVCLLGCEDVGKKSAELAKSDLPILIEAAKNDVGQVRSGLPKGAQHIEELFRAAAPEVPAFDSTRDALVKARDKTQDLRVAKSTFFAVALLDGKVLRNDQKQDLMAGKSLFPGFDSIKSALTAGYVEGHGQMTEANGVKGEDGQWVAAVGIKVGPDPRGYYVTGWSWSAYAYRLQMALRSAILSRTESGGKVPLTYVYLVVQGQAFGAPTAPLVTAKVLAETKILEKLKGGPVYSEVREIEGRVFGIAAALAPDLGSDVAVAIVRSET